MTKGQIMPKVIFFAYQGRRKGQSDENVEAIKAAIQQHNQYVKHFEAKSWEDYTETTAISKDILTAIDNCEVFVSDMTYFNHNVLFEFGYAVAKGKNILVLLNESINNAKSKYNEFILNNIRYTPIVNATDISNALKKGNYRAGLINTFVNINNIDLNSVDLFYVQSKTQNQYAIDLTEMLKYFKENNGISLVSDDSLEVNYQPLKWYISNFIKSRIVIIHYLGEKTEGWIEENAKNSFYAGLACGLNKEVLLVAPAEYRPPLDYRDIMITYETSADLIDNTKQWLDKRVKKPVEDKTAMPDKETHELNLIKLGIGCDVAEYENKEDLLSYFIDTSSYNIALNYNKSILIGRKGSGKTAIYIKLLDELVKDKLNYTINLMPESDELLEEIQMSALYTAAGSKKTFFFTVWNLVILSRLALLIYDRLSEIQSSAGYTEAENNIISFVERNEAFIKLNFLGIVREINNKIKATREINSPDVLNSLYKEYLTPLIDVIKKYFRAINQKYYKIIVIADGLDKTWDSQSGLDVQNEMILTLFDIGAKLHKSLIDKKDEKIDVKEIIFLRKDIFDYIIQKTTDPDKMMTTSHEINWEENPALLKSMVERRVQHVLQDEHKAEDVWRDYFDLKGKRAPFDIIVELVTKRPRDIIYFISKLFESAVDKGHHKVNEQDLEYAIDNYTKFLNFNLIAETKAEYPEIGNILNKLQKYQGQIIEYNKFRDILKQFKYDNNKIDKFIENLFKKGYLIGFDNKEKKPIIELGALKSKLGERRFYFFQNKVFIVPHAEYWFIKNKRTSPFISNK